MIVTIEVESGHMLRLIDAMRSGSNVMAGYYCARCEGLHEGQILSLHPEICSIQVELTEA
jgi:hypothetical protein